MRVQGRRQDFERGSFSQKSRNFTVKFKNFPKWQRSRTPTPLTTPMGVDDL
jgi:hypothetical protein